MKELKKGGKAPRSSARPTPAEEWGQTSENTSDAAPAAHIDDVDETESDWLSDPSPLETSLARQDLKMLHESLKVMGVLPVALP